MILGAQLFGVNFRSPLTALENLKKLAEMGYAFVEPCISADPIPGLEKAVWPMGEFKAMLPKIREMGLEVPSIHFFAEPVNPYADLLKQLCLEEGIRYVVVKTPRDMSELSLQKASMEYMTLADRLQEAGAKLLIHNENTDIEAKIDGISVYEKLLDLCQGRVFAELDVGWVHYAGEDEVAFLKRNLYRTAIVHYKDFSEDKKPVVIGNGTCNLKAIFEIARAHGIPHLADQDQFVTDVFTDMQEVISNMSRLGQIRTEKSYLNVMNIETGEIEVLASFDKVIEAPNWLKKTDELVYNSEGHLYAFKLADKSIRLIETGECDRCNNDHVLAPDESGVAVSHSPITKEGWSSRIYTVPFDTGIPKLITPRSPSFLHGWSPDGKDLAYCAFRQVDGALHVDIYTAPADGSGEEVRLTGEGFNDGPEYSPDGEYIWFISTRTGLMQVWRMRKDGSEQTQMTFNEQNNWFGHVSPDGEKVVYLSYHKGHLSPNEHLPNMQVELWLMNSDGTDQHRICSFFGGQGSINVNSWAADSRRFAFVSYALD